MEGDHVDYKCIESVCAYAKDGLRESEPFIAVAMWL